MASFQVFKDRSGEYRWRLRSSGNSKIIADSGEGYSSKQACLDGIQLVKDQAPSAQVEDQTSA